MHRPVTPLATGSRPHRKPASSPIETPQSRRLTCLAAMTVAALLRCAVAQVATTDPIVVDAERLVRAPQLRLDDILRAQVPGFNLFRRNSSRTANPTTQGVTLRNFGPSGTGRTLVLLDGIPLNDRGDPLKAT
jgi:hypothetical protein